MRVLGIHFGHDAGVALIENGKVRVLAQAERHSRQKHVSGLSYRFISQVLERLDLDARQIDYCAITTTQSMDIILDRREPLDIEYARHPDDRIPSKLGDMIRADPALADMPLELLLDHTLSAPDIGDRKLRRREYLGKNLGIPPEHAKAIASFNRTLFDFDSPLARPCSLRELAADYDLRFADLEAYRHDFHFPVTFVLDGHRIPGCLLNHHAGHAAAAYYQSPFQSSAILTLDGGCGYHEGGLFWFGRDNDIVPVRVHYLELGRIYLRIANYGLKMGSSAEGKMMGLSSYGKPTFFRNEFVANGAKVVADDTATIKWEKFLSKKIHGPDSTYDRSAIGVPEKLLSPVNADVAASTQLLFEETMLEATRQLELILQRAGLATSDISLSGGCMLNCPTNTRISRETKFKNVFVEPACDDGGLPVGAALWAYFNLMRHPRSPADGAVAAELPYLGLPLRPSDFDVALSANAERILVEFPLSITQTCAELLAAGQVVGWFEGRSEVGPRALGHRSIVADPRGKDTWTRVNAIKGREAWRPLAPSVLEDRCAEWFADMPSTSPFMMFTGRAVNTAIPAVTHVDGTARVQTVSPQVGAYYDLIKRFADLTGCPVVLNTSMNGPGQPIAEYPADAIAMLLDGRFDVLALENRLIRRAA
ncbi:MAG: carbamoyltransferase C-terminal domain-containing protein [Rhodospirillaceae bacterium]|nr:carbamoyltransferase C-terminal domain-containing protein [Rhodospirillaceae bacterium]